MKSVALHNLGCKVNGYEMDVMQQMLQENGYKIVSFDEVADIYIVNTCTVTNIADRKSRQMLHRAKKQNPNAVVVAVGCYVQTGGAGAAADEAVDLVVGNNRKRQIVSILEDYLNNGKQEDTVIDIGHTDEYEQMRLTKTAEHTRAYIKIQDGCNQFCSYCIIPYARGRVRSRGEADILNEVRDLAAAGCKEIVLTGIHISSYGIDTGSPKLTALLAKLQDIGGIRRIRLGSLEPRIVTEEFVRQVSAMPKICPHFHLSLQSGCDTVLARMNRHYTSGEYFQTTELLRKYYENPAITTDVIVGFPGETAEEFGITERFVRSVGFYEMHIFKYSKRKGTRAAAMDGQLTEAEKSRRSAILSEAKRQMSHTYRESCIGSKQEVLFEEKKTIGGREYWTGHTPQYVKAAKEADSSPDLGNQILQGTITGFLDEDVMILK